MQELKTAHRGALVRVVRPCTFEEADVIWDKLTPDSPEEIFDRMYKVKAPDGWEGDAWESELATL